MAVEIANGKATFCVESWMPNITKNRLPRCPLGGRTFNKSAMKKITPLINLVAASQLCGSEKKLGRGNDSFFQSKDWVGSCLLRDRFRRLHNLSSQKYKRIANMGTWKNSVQEQWKFKWRRVVRGKESSWLNELLMVVDSVPLREGIDNKWIWPVGEEDIYIVHSAYLFLQGPKEDDVDRTFDLVWSSPVPSNVQAFTQRLVLDRIQSKENRRHRGVIEEEDDSLCTFCNQIVETTNPIFFNCSLSHGIWAACYNWLGFNVVLPSEPKNHFLQHSYFGKNQNQKKTLMSIWKALAWTIWIQRNNQLPRDGTLDATEALDLAKFKAWNWLWIN